MKKLRISFSIILSLVLLIALSTVAFAAGKVPVVTFDANTELFTYEDTDTYVADDGTIYPDLFTEFKDAIPGDSFTQEIQVKTKNINGKIVHIYLHSENPNDEYLEIMESAIFTVYYEGEVISEGTLADGIKLGTFTSDETMNITVEFAIPLEVDNRISKLYGTIDWVFIAELLEDEPVEDPPEETPEETPKTGDDSNLILWVVIAAVSAGGVVAIKARK